MPRIEYISLDFENAYIYRKCSVPLANQGLVLLRGLNLDDGGYLGAGKSSIFEMFAQTQIGKGGKRDHRRGDHRSDIVNMFAGGDLHAALTLRVDGRLYKIHQYRDHYRFGNQVFVEDVEAGQKNIIPKDASRAPHKWIRDYLLRIDETTFFNLIYLGQELNNVMIHGKEADRRSRLTAMFNLDVYDNLYQSARKTLALHQTTLADIEEVRTELEDVEQRLASAPDLDSVEEELEGAVIRLSSLQSEHAEDVEEYSALAQLVGQLKSRDELRVRIMRRFKASPLKQKFQKPLDLQQTHVDAWKKTQDNLSAELTTVAGDLARLSKKSVLEGQLRLLAGRDIDEIQEDLTGVKTKLTFLTTIELPQSEERASLLLQLQSIGKITHHVDVLEEELQTTMRADAALQPKIDGLSAQLHDAICPTCKRPFDNMTSVEISQKQQLLQELRKSMEEVSAHLIKVKQQLKAEKSAQRVLLRMGALETERTPEEVMLDIRQLSGTERRLTAEIETSQRKAQIEVELASMPAGNEVDLSERVARLTRELEATREYYESASFIVEKLAELSLLPTGDLEDAERQARAVRQRMRGAASAISDVSAVVANLKTTVQTARELRRRRSTLCKASQQRDSIIQEATCLSSLVKSFGPAGLKQDRFHAILSDAAERTVPAYSDILWPSRNIVLRLSDIDGSLQLELTRTDTGLSTGSSLLSGGERHKSGLAFLFGMRDLKELYTGSSSNILVVDEPFGNLDPLGTEGLVSIFSMLKLKFSSVFVISHRPEVLSHPVWDKTWWAVRQDNNAQLYLGDLPASYQQIADELVKQ